MIEVTYTYTDTSGKKARKHFYGHTRREAERKRDEFKRMIENGVRSDAQKKTVAAWVDEYAETYGADGFKSYIDRINKSIGGRNLDSIHEADLQRLLNDAANMSYSYMNKYSQIIKRIFRKANTNRLIMFDPSADLTIPECERGTHRALEPWEVNLIINHADHRTGIWFLLMLLAGLRRGEMIALQWDCVDLNSRVIHVRRAAKFDGNRPVIYEGAKSEAGVRDVPICDELEIALKRAKTAVKSIFVCTLADYQPITEIGFKRGLEAFINHLANYCPKGKTISFRAHDLRHTYATLLHAYGVDIKTAQTWLGHADSRVTLDVYTHLTDLQNKQDADRFNAGIKSTRRTNVVYSDQKLKNACNSDVISPASLTTNQKVVGSNPAERATENDV